jgi:hypothetical protein
MKDMCMNCVCRKCLKNCKEVKLEYVDAVTVYGKCQKCNGITSKCEKTK